ncbi:MAG: cytochrome c [Gemmatimonadota bacterium]|nr:cytochrome c [Gemmatimonadota bacterium]MDH3421362.1 cytochrome c [Gemmatimonadota bacterium]
MRKTLLTTPWIGTCLAAAAAMLFVAGPAAAQSMATAAPTYSKDIAPIVQDVCMRCHVEGGLGPFLLTNYQEVRRYAQRIRQSVLQRSMPPWHLDPTIGIQAFNNDISLSREEVDAVIAWVDAGAPEGDRADLPPLPEARWTWGESWELESRLGPPDVLVNSGPIPIPAEGQDVWPDVTLPWQALDETRYLRAAEIRNTVSGRRALHHNNVRLNLEGQPSGRMVGAGASKTYDLFAEDTGIRLDAGPGQLNWGLHYALYGEAFVDTVEVALWFYPKDEPPLYESTVEYHHLIDQYTPGEPRGRDILIPPHGTQTMTRVVVLDEPIMINSIRPHMHLHGVGQSVEVIWPVRERDYLGHTASPGEMLSSVNNYDHNWQTSYSYQEQARPLLPKGTALMFRTHFDNTANNPLAVDPDQWVAFGARSVDGMSHMHTAISYLSQEQYETLLQERIKIAQEELTKPEEERLEVFLPLEGRRQLDRRPALD